MSHFVIAVFHNVTADEQLDCLLYYRKRDDEPFAWSESLTGFISDVEVETNLSEEVVDELL